MAPPCEGLTGCLGRGTHSVSASPYVTWRGAAGGCDCTASALEAPLHGGGTGLISGRFPAREGARGRSYKEALGGWLLFGLN